MIHVQPNRWSHIDRVDRGTFHILVDLQAAEHEAGKGENDFMLRKI